MRWVSGWLNESCGKLISVCWIDGRTSRGRQTISGALDKRVFGGPQVHLKNKTDNFLYNVDHFQLGCKNNKILTNVAMNNFSVKNVSSLASIQLAKKVEVLQKKKGFKKAFKNI